MIKHIYLLCDIIAASKLMIGRPYASYVQLPEVLRPWYIHMCMYLFEERHCNHTRNANTERTYVFPDISYTPLSHIPSNFGISLEENQGVLHVEERLRWKLLDASQRFFEERGQKAVPFLRGRCCHGGAIWSREVGLKGGKGWKMMEFHKKNLSKIQFVDV